MTSLSKTVGRNEFVTLFAVVVLVVFLHGLYERRTMRDYVNAKLAGR